MTLTTLLLTVAGIAQLAGQPGRPTGALATVVSLYREYSWEAAIDEPLLQGNEISGPPDQLRRFFDDALVALLLRNQKCESRSKGICAIDFLPIWDGQDAAGLTVRIVPGKDSTKVVATVRNEARVDVSQMTYTLVKTAAGWRVHDIAYNKHESLVTLLKGRSGRLEE